MAYYHKIKHHKRHLLSCWLGFAKDAGLLAARLPFSDRETGPRRSPRDLRDRRDWGDMGKPGSLSWVYIYIYWDMGIWGYICWVQEILIFW